MLARLIYGSDGKAYVIIGEIPRRPRESPVWRYLNPRFLSLRLLVIFIVASIFCYWLAWYLTSPVRKLRTASQQLASGDLKTRVVPELGRRTDELADLGQDFDLMAERIELLLNSQGRLLRDISHELRSPLARLNVALELVRQRSGKEAEEALDNFHTNYCDEFTYEFPDLSIFEDCCIIAGHYNTVKYKNIYNNLAKIYKFSVKTPWKKLSDKAKNIFLYGSEEKWLKMKFIHPRKQYHAALLLQARSPFASLFL